MRSNSTSTETVVLYTRVSSDKQEIDGTSLDTQLAACRAYCQEHGYQIVGEFTDTHTGAQYRERPGLSQMRELIRAGAVDVVVCHALDRLSRDQTHMAVLVDEIEHHGARLELVTESFEDSAVGKFIRAAKSFASEVEREKLTERVSRGRRARAENGKYLPGRTPPFGLSLSADRTNLEVNADMMPVLRRMFADYAGGGTLRGIALALTADGIPTPQQEYTGNSVWDPTTVRHLLTNPIYIGTMQSHHGTIELNGIAPAVIDPVTFATVQRRLSTNRQRSRRNAQYPENIALLRAGLVVCGVCGSNMMVRHDRRYPGTADYMCRATEENQCSRHSMRTHLLDEAVWEGLRRRLLEDDLFVDGSEGLKAADPGPELTVIERTLAGVERQHANIARRIALTDDDDSAAALMAQLDQLSRRRRELEVEREAVTGQVERWQRSRQVLDDLDVWRRRTAATLERYTFKQRREFLELIELNVQLWPTDHEPRWLATSKIIPSIVLSAP